MVSLGILVGYENGCSTGDTKRAAEALVGLATPFPVSPPLPLLHRPPLTKPLPAGAAMVFVTWLPYVSCHICMPYAEGALFLLQIPLHPSQYTLCTSWTIHHVILVAVASITLLRIRSLMLLRPMHLQGGGLT